MHHKKEKIIIKLEIRDESKGEDFTLEAKSDNIGKGKKLLESAKNVFARQEKIGQIKQNLAEMSVTEAGAGADALTADVVGSKQIA